MGWQGFVRFIGEMYGDSDEKLFSAASSSSLDDLRTHLASFLEELRTRGRSERPSDESDELFPLAKPKNRFRRVGGWDAQEGVREVGGWVRLV